MEKFQRVLGSFEHMTTLSRELVQLASFGTKSEIRKKIDQLRTSRALLIEDQAFLIEAIEKQQLSKDLIQKFKLHLEVEKIADNFIGQWIRKLNIDKSENVNAIQVEEINDLLDMLIPKTWNFKTDIIVLEENQEELFFKPLLERGQKRFIFVSGTKNEISKDLVYTTGDNAQKIMEHYIFPHPKTLNFLSRMVNDQKVSNKYIEFTDALKEELHKSIIKLNTMRRFSKTWAFNSIKNLPSVLNEKSIWDLEKSLNNCDIIIVNPGPSLKNNIVHLKKNNNKVIFAVAQAIPALLEAGVIPHFILVIDPQDFTQVIDKLSCEHVSLICPEYISKSFTSKNFKNIFYCHSGKGSLSLPKNLKVKRVDMDNAASVSVAAVSLLIQLKVNSIALVGQDLSWEDHQYSSEALQVEIFEKNHVLPGYYGGKVKTGYTYFVFHGQLEEIAHNNSLSNGPSLFNCTEGGAYISGFKNFTLDDYMKKVPKKDYVEYSYNNNPFLGYRSFYKSELKIYHRQLKLLIDDLKKWVNYSSPDLKIKSSIETRIFDQSNTIPILKDAIYSDLWKFADTLALGFNNELVDFQKGICVTDMLKVSEELLVELGKTISNI